MLLNKGSYSDVYCIKDTKNDEYVLKIFLKKGSTHFKNEVFILKGIDHPYILYMFNHNDKYDKDYILFEYCRYGDLLAYVNHFREQDLYIEQSQIKLIFKQILTGMEYLHNTCKICHRDLKLENILISEKKDDKVESIKICDFGFSSKNNIFTKYDGGTTEYLPPEFKFNEIHNGFKTDVWSLGVILYLLLKLEYPKGDLLICKQINLQTVSYLGKMLNKNARYRADISELLTDNWIDKKRKFTNL